MHSGGIILIVDRGLGFETTAQMCAASPFGPNADSSGWQKRASCGRCTDQQVADLFMTYLIQRDIRSRVARGKLILGDGSSDPATAGKRPSRSCVQFLPNSKKCTLAQSL
jgi:hypothetical protein